jgi:hypothetical protein
MEVRTSYIFSYAFFLVRTNTLLNYLHPFPTVKLGEITELLKILSILNILNDSSKL